MQHVTMVFQALADPTRRMILERLRSQGPLSVKQLSEPFSISRQAVTKHLDILLNSGLVEVHRLGRERLHSLDPAPLRQIETWLKPYSEEWDRRLERLQRHLEEHT